MATYEEILKRKMEKDERFIVLTAENRAVIRGMPQWAGGRFLDTGITEQTMIGMAAGLASQGRVPICHALATFLTLRAFEFIRTDVGISGLPVKLVGGVPGFLSDGNGPTHQAIEDVSIMRGIPPMRVFCPGDEADLLTGLEAVLDDPHPWYIRYNPRKTDVSHAPFVIGKSERLSEGNDIALLTYGTLLKETLEAAEKLRANGLTVRVENLRSLKPIDEAALTSALTECRLVTTVEDHFLTGGLFTILSEVAMRNRMTGHVLPLALDNHWFKPARLNEVIDYEGFTGEKIADRCLKRWQDLKSEVSRG